MKELPLGIQNLPEIINRNLLYVDKTPLAHELATKGKHYFLSRPRRFGKSLFLNTLEEIFLGNKDLFKGLSIYDSGYSWEKHPIIHLSFGSLNHDSSKQFEIDIKDTLIGIAKSYGVNITGSSIQMQLSSLVKNLREINPVVVLIDEYDKPILDHLRDPELLEKNRGILRGFFGTLKDMDNYLRFTFVTGISRFSRASLFSGFNNLEDISFYKNYAAIGGYTEEEVGKYFEEHIRYYAKEHGQTPLEVREFMKSYYNGYRFSKSPLKVYNPYSTLSFLKAVDAANYWYNSATPTFLVDQVAKYPRSVEDLSGLIIPEHKLHAIADPDKTKLASLMFQAGYLTIKDFEEKNLILDFPNREVRESFFDTLLEHFSGEETQAFHKTKALFKAFELGDISQVVELVNTHLAQIPYSLYTDPKEAFFHIILLFLLELSGIPCRKEELTSKGRIDLLIEREKLIYIVECKLDKSANEALKQIKEKGYLEPYFNRGKKVVALGLNFDSKERKISDYLIEKYSEDGKLLKD